MRLISPTDWTQARRQFEQAAFNTKEQRNRSQLLDRLEEAIGGSIDDEQYCYTVKSLVMSANNKGDVLKRLKLFTELLQEQTELALFDACRFPPVDFDDFDGRRDFIDIYEIEHGNQTGSITPALVDILWLAERTINEELSKLRSIDLRSSLHTIKLHENLANLILLFNSLWHSIQSEDFSQGDKKILRTRIKRIWQQLKPYAQRRILLSLANQPLKQHLSELPPTSKQMRPIDQREIDDLKIYCQPIEDEPGWYTCPPEEMTQVFLRYLKVGLSRIAMIISLKSGENLEGTMKIRDFTTFESRNKKGETSQHELEDLAEWKLRLE